jgi:ATP sulfurylase
MEGMLDVLPSAQVLLQYEGQKLGVLEVEDVWVPNKARETRVVYGTSALEHPGAGWWGLSIASMLRHDTTLAKDDFGVHRWRQVHCMA